MAEVVLATSSEKQVWRKQYFREYVRQTGFSAYMGTSQNSIIRWNKDLVDGGKFVNIPLILSLRGYGVRGSQVLVGQEDILNNYNDQIQVDWIRNGIVVPKSTSYLTEVDIWNAGKDALKEWSAKTLRNDVIDAFGGIIVPGATTGSFDTSVLYPLATTTQKNTFLANNGDRILMGNSLANTSSLNWATSLGNIDSTNDRFTVAVSNLAKRLAMQTGESNSNTAYQASPAMTPYTAMDGVYSGWVCFMAPNSFRDLQNDPVMISANRDARPREGGSYKDNPLFMDGDLLYNGIIFRQIPELARLKLTGVGTSGIDVDRNFLCGQGALGVAWGQLPKPTRRAEDDYGFRPGYGYEECRGQKKSSYLGITYGVVEIDTASVNDS